MPTKFYVDSLTGSSGPDVQISEQNEVIATEWIYFGDKFTNGSWRIGINPLNPTHFTHQRLESGTWISKLSIDPVTPP
jgi:hypothetical protein